jgi:hypothetical protein
MYTRIQQKVASLCVGFCTVVSMIFGTPAAARGWQEAMLLTPSESQLRLEARGRVMIYEGLTDRQVAQAMDTQFSRIESMMFIRTVITDEEGKAVEVEDDDCE